MDRALGDIAALSYGLNTPPAAEPGQYASRQFPYLGEETVAFYAQYAKYASDFFSARIQGLDPEDFYAWLAAEIRMADVSNLGVTQTYPEDDWKVVLIPSRMHDYLPAGAKVETMGSTWLCVNPQNLSGGLGNGIIRRCNATWNHLDYYGNVLREPIAIDNSIAKAPAPDPQDYNIIARGYYAIQCQYNPQTAQLGINSRLILGTGAYAITSQTDFMEEFTGEAGSVHLLRFHAQYQEPNREIDDMERRVAGGRQFHWQIQVSGTGVLPAGATAQFAAQSRRMGETVTGSDEHPISYLWQSSNPAVAAVDSQGVVTGLAPGKCEIRAALAQNGSIVSEPFPLEITEASGHKAAFTEDPPDSLRAYESTQLRAALYVDGAETDEVPAWSFSGAQAGTYSAQIDGRTVKLSCYGYSAAPLLVTAAFGENVVQASITLAGI